MAYIGNAPAEAYSTISKQTITGNGTVGPYTLDYAVANGNEIEVFVNNVRQEPSVAYTVSGTALTMTGTVASTDDFYVVFQGKAVQTIVPADATVTTAMLQDSSVTSAKIAAGTVTAADLASTLDLSGKTLTLPNNNRGFEFLGQEEYDGVTKIEISSSILSTDYDSFLLDFAVAPMTGTATTIYISFSDDAGSSYINMDSVYEYRQHNGSSPAQGINSGYAGVGGINNNAAPIGVNQQSGDLIRGQVWLYNGKLSVGTAARRNVFYANGRTLCMQNNTGIYIEMTETMMRQASSVSGFKRPTHIKIGNTANSYCDMSVSVYGVSNS